MTRDTPPGALDTSTDVVQPFSRRKFSLQDGLKSLGADLSAPIGQTVGGVVAVAGRVRRFSRELKDSVAAGVKQRRGSRDAGAPASAYVLPVEPVQDVKVEEIQ